jgi:hypothetical protein
VALAFLALCWRLWRPFVLDDSPCYRLWAEP